MAFILLSSCLRNKSKDIVIQPSGIQRIRPDFQGTIEGEFYSINLDLINNTDSIFKFWTNSCSWQSNWLFNTNALGFYVECPKNVPVITQIKAHEKITYKGIIELRDTSYTRSLFKVGFVVIKQNEVINDPGFVSILTTKIGTGKDIIWSESFKLSK